MTETETSSTYHPLLTARDGVALRWKRRRTVLPPYAERSTRGRDQPPEPPAHLSVFRNSPTLSNRSILGRDPGRRRRSEVVILTGFLASELTRGYERFEDRVVHAVNGVSITSIEHLAQLLDSLESEFVEISMREGGLITLRREQVLSESPEILTRYQVSADRSSDLAVPASLAE